MSTAADSSPSTPGTATEDALEPRNVMISHSQWERLRTVAFEQRRSMSEIVREALDAHLPSEPAETGAA